MGRRKTLQKKKKMHNLSKDVHIHLGKRIMLWLMQEKIWFIVIAMVVGYLLLFEISMWVYFKYFTNLDMDKVNEICNHPTFSSCDDIFYSKEYCTKSDFKKELIKCNYNMTRDIDVLH